MSKVKVELNHQGIEELLRSPEMANIVLEVASDIARRAGSDYSSRVHDSGQRQIANVFPNSKEAARDNYENNTLLKAIGG